MKGKILFLAALAILIADAKCLFAEQSGNQAPGTEGRPDADYHVTPEKDSELREKWKQKNVQMRGLELRHLCLRTDGRLTAFVASLLDSDPNPGVRSEAASSLGHCGDSSTAISALKKHINDPDRLVRYRVAESLASRNQWGDVSSIFIMEISSGDWNGGRSALGGLWRKYNAGAEARSAYRERLVRVREDSQIPIDRRTLAVLAIGDLSRNDFTETDASTLSEFFSHYQNLTQDEDVKKVLYVLNTVRGLYISGNMPERNRQLVLSAIAPAAESTVPDIKTSALKSKSEIEKSEK